VAEVLFGGKEESSEGWNPVARAVLKGERVGLEEELPDDEGENRGCGLLWILLAVFVLTAAGLALAYYFGWLNFGTGAG
jgi:hypothetical protein